MGASLARLFECLVDEWTVVEEAKVEPDARGEKRIFALIRRKTAKQKGGASARRFTSNSSSGDRYDYENKYAEDPEGEGMAANARVWRVYLDEAGHFDADMVENIRDTVDVILVSAGLFSAVVCTFVGQASTALRPDFSQVTAALLIELIAVQRAMVSGTVLGTVLPSALNLDSPSTASSADRWVNGLWFVSLAVSLATALLAVLVKQWIQAYVAPTFGTPHFQSRIRHFRYMGMEQWHVPLIAGLLPILLHLSLFLFFAGLVVLLFTLDHIIAGFVSVIGTLAYSAYLITNLLPVWFSQCPYKTPLSRYIYITISTLGPPLRWCLGALQKLVKPATNLITPLHRIPLREFHFHFHQLRSALFVLSDLYLVKNQPEVATSDNSEHQSEQEQPRTLQLAEHVAVNDGGDHLDAQMLSWLCDMSGNPSVSSIAVSAVSDLPIGFSALETLRNNVLPHACTAFNGCFHRHLYPRIRIGMESKVYTYLLAHTQLGPGEGCTCFVNVNEHILEEEPRLCMVNFLENHDLVVDACGLGVGEDSQVPTASNLRQSQPPASSKRTWILLLQRALLAGSRSPGSHFDLENDGDTFFYFLYHVTQETWSPDTADLRDRPFIRLEGILLFAYLYQWTLPPSTTLKHHHLLRTEINSEHQSMHRETMERYVRSSSQRESTEQLETYYHMHIILHILVHCARRSPDGQHPLLYVSEQLYDEQNRPESWEPPLHYYLRSLPAVPFPESLNLPDNHPILEQLHKLIPTTNFMHTLLQDMPSESDWHKSHRLQSTALRAVAVTYFLALSVTPWRLIPIIQAHDVIGAFHIVMKAFPPCIYLGTPHLDNIDIYCATVVILKAFSSCPNLPGGYPTYMQSYLKEVCSWILAAFVVGHSTELVEDASLLGAQERLSPYAFSCMQEVALFIAGHTPSASEYDLAWEEALHELPTVLLDKKHRLHIERFTDWIRPELAKLYETHKQRSVKAISATQNQAARRNLWSKCRSTLHSVIPGLGSLRKHDHQLRDTGSAQVAIVELEQGAGARTTRARSTEERFEEV